MKIPVLTYHTTNISGNEYHLNDHIALENDLVSWLNGLMKFNTSSKYVVITFDDGSELDCFDWEHPTWGFQRSFYTIMKTHSIKVKRYVHATSFVIASQMLEKFWKRLV